MKDIRLVHKDSEQSMAKLKRFYEKGSIAPEKKPYLLDMKRSIGPYLAVEDNHYILDASSQIASVGTGFNGVSLHGAAHHLEAWLNLKGTENSHAVRKAFETLLQKKLAWPKLNTSFCHSGAEANEIALGECFRKRSHKERTRILAFEGSFHGRMMAALSATWNPVKRQQFEWKGYEAEFVAHPNMQGDQFLEPKFNDQWIRCWELANHSSFQAKLKVFTHKKDELLQRELTILKKIREKLKDNTIFAVILEPMQCEGGYHYSSSRFHHALLQLCHAYEVPLVYDEVQTGFGFSGTFFWHRQFKLKDSLGQPIYPDYVVCAKKSQVGMVLSHQSFDREEQFSSVSMIRGYYQATWMDQHRESILNLEKLVRPRLNKLCRTFSQLIHTPKAKGLSFSFDFKDSTLLMDFIKARFKVGLLFYPAGSHTARFCLNCAYRISDLDLLFDRFKTLLKVVQNKDRKQDWDFKDPDKLSDPVDNRQVHLELLKHKWYKKHSSIQVKKKMERIQALLFRNLSEEIQGSLKLIDLNKNNLKKYAKAIQTLQKDVYEKTRQTSLSFFEEALRSKQSLGFLLIHQKQLIGLACAASLSMFKHERGVMRDPHFMDETSLYCMDVTVHSKWRGHKLGKLLKTLLISKAGLLGLKRVNSRNRDVAARMMLGINQSLGSYTREWIEGDYPDDAGHSDCLYQTNPTHWQKPPLNLSNGIESHLEIEQIKPTFIKRNLHRMVNKVCLSNFVSEDYLNDLDTFIQELPKALQHVYSSSGMSEAVDKVTKVLWLQGQPKQRMLTFEGCSFGEGSFMSRSLSNKGESYFEIDRLPFPKKNSSQHILKEVRKILNKKQTLGVWLEPLTHKSLQAMPLSFLKELKKCCQQYKVPLIYNDTGSLFNRYAEQAFCASNIAAIRPDIAFSYLGGQMAVVYMKKELWHSTPLMFISTWDGDEYSLASFVEAMHWMKQEKSPVLRFEKTLTRFLKSYGIKEIHLQNGVGWFEGSLPPHIRQLFKRVDEGCRYVVCPSRQVMKRFMVEHTSL